MRGVVCEGAAEFEACDLTGCAGEFVRFIDYDEVPAGVDEVMKPLLVVVVDLFWRPSPAAFHGFYGIERDDDLVKQRPDLPASGNLVPGGSRDYGDELFLEVCPHL